MYRVALVTHDYFQSGGTRTMTRFLRDALEQSTDFAPAIISVATSKDDSNSVRLRHPGSWRKGVLVTEESDDGIPVLRIGSWGAEMEFLRYRSNKRLAEVLSTFDIIQFVVGTPPWACLGREISRPVFLWTATMIRTDRESRLRSAPIGRRLWMRMMTEVAVQQERTALRSVDKVFALSEYTLAAVEKIAGRSRSVLAPCGVDTTFFSPAQTRQKYIVCAGRLSDPRKNVGLLIAAYQKVAGIFEDPPELWLVGPEPVAEVLALIDSDHRHRIKILGSRSSAELAEIYRNALFFVLSSDEEGLGIVLLEAMASGLPVVSTACGGPDSIVIDGETGILVPVGNREAFANAMARLIKDPGLRERMASASRERVAEKFSNAAASEVFLTHYQQMVRSNEKTLHC